MKRFAWLVVIVIAVGCRPAPPDPAPRSVVLITLDTTRADRLSPYGYMNVELPHLERLAKEGVVFDQAISVAPLTLPVHTSLLTGLLPPNHGVRDNADTPLGDAETTLAETLRTLGFRTGAFVGSVVLGPDRGLKQGFERYAGVAETAGLGPAALQRRADAVIDDAIRWLETVDGERFFLWTHLYDAHRPYDPPEPYGSLYGHNPYVGEIAFVDSQIGRLIDTLDRRKLLDDIVLVVAGDHGESLGDHGERDHGVFVYEEVMRVPLIVRARGRDPRRVGGVVSLTDVYPTVLDLLNIPSPPVDGVSLVDLMAGRERGPGREAYSESLYPERLGWSPLRALRDQRFKLIDAPRPELFDLDHDPFEKHNIYEEHPAMARAMTARLAAISQGRKAAHAPDRQAGVTSEVGARLAALGYLAAGGAVRTTDLARLPDPKDCIGSGGAAAARALATMAGCRHSSLPPQR